MDKTPLTNHFPRDNAPVNRDEIRAYYDSIRDIACYEHGYKLLRIMHGQIDFESDDAAEQLSRLLTKALRNSTIDKSGVSDSASIEQHLNKAPFIKVAMYLQTDELKNKKAFDKIMPVMTNADGVSAFERENDSFPTGNRFGNLAG